MSSYDDFYENICRLCLSFCKSENMVPLFDNLNNFSHYGKGVVTFSNICLKSNDELPKKMCTKCLFFLRQAAMFKLNCESSDKQLKYLANCSAFGSETLKEKIVQYCIYKFYFPTEPSSKPAINNDQSLQKHHTSTVDSILHSKYSHENEKNLYDMKEVITHNNDNKLRSNNFDQSPCNSIKQKFIADDDQLLDIMEKMIGTHSEIYDDFKQSKGKRIMKRRKVLKGIKSQNKLNKINGNKTNFKCRICHKILANPLTYKQHMQRHTGCRYICEHCGKGFPVSAELNIHRVARHGTGPYLQCQHCSFKAPRKFDLKEHERIHTGERPYACDKCGLTFRRRGIWRKHMVYHSEKNVQCTQCPRKFFQRSAMLAHANNIHHRMYVYLCNKCGVTYAKPATVRRHLTERHGIPREMQGKVIRVNKVSV